MSRVLRVVSVLLLGLALGGCTAAAKTATSASTPGGAGRAVADEAGSDVGNDRPHVTFDGLMVRRRVVIAIRPAAGADLGSVQKEMDRAAERQHLTLSTISPDVLDPALLESLSPQLALALPSGTTLTEARRVIDPAPAQARRFPDVAAYDVSPVLVHDLRFTASSVNPAALAQAIEREGILSDALGNYATTLGRHELDITYTGPLLSDDLVESVRVGIARRAHIAPAAVAIHPRSTTGTGVDMAKEPAPAPVPLQASAAHHHGSGLPTAAGSSNTSPWAVSNVAVTVMLILTLVLVIARRKSRPTEA